MSINCRDYPPMPGGVKWPHVDAPASCFADTVEEYERLRAAELRAIDIAAKIAADNYPWQPVAGTMDYQFRNLRARYVRTHRSGYALYHTFDGKELVCVGGLMNAHAALAKAGAA